MHINSRYPIRHSYLLGGSGERARDYINQGLGLSPLPSGEKTTHHLFARSRTLRIRHVSGLRFSTVSSISPHPAPLNYGSAPSGPHGAFPLGRQPHLVISAKGVRFD